MLFTSLSRPVLLQLRRRAMSSPCLLENALVGSCELYDENGDEEGLIANLMAFLG